MSWKETSRGAPWWSLRNCVPGWLLGVWILWALVLAGCDGVIRGDPSDGGNEQKDANTSSVDGALPTDGSGFKDAHIPHDGEMVDTSIHVDGYLPVDSSTLVDGSSTEVQPPLGGSSGGAGGSVYPTGTSITDSGVSFTLIVPNSYSDSTPNRFMIVYSGTEGETTMASNVRSVAPIVGLDDVIFAVLDGVTYNGNASAGATALDYVRTHYNISNDETFLLSESAGTTAGLALGLDLRQSYFAAYWVNDVNAAASPTLTSSELGFAPWGNAGPGGDFADANAIVNAMSVAGYRLPADAPYSGSGSDTHGSADQFIAAMQFFDGKSRQ